MVSYKLSIIPTSQNSCKGLSPTNVAAAEGHKVQISASVATDPILWAPGPLGTEKGSSTMFREETNNEISLWFRIHGNCVCLWLKMGRVKTEPLHHLMPAHSWEVILTPNTAGASWWTPASAAVPNHLNHLTCGEHD